MDQATKFAVRQAFHPGQGMDLIPGVLLLTHVRNEGAAFGLMPGFRPLFIVTSVCVIAGIGLYAWRRRPTAIWLVTALALTAAGATGNLIDRVLMGRVTDFIDPQIFPVFNVADSGIVVGAIMLALWIMLDEAHATEDVAVEDEVGPCAGENAADPSSGAIVEPAPGTATDLPEGLA